ncbi:hypothetical protein J4458_03715 [Candidatus Woesearchaeota archaeon]|nr:hypothetical protein [Candidatus Woesearchaeota archaeon]
MVAEFLFRSWAEFFFFAVMVVGIVVSLSAPSAVISYIVIFVSGMMAGRLMYWRKHNMHFAYYLIIVGFLIGYLLGAYYGNRNVIVILFILGAFFGYYLYEKKILRDTLF